MAMWRRIFLAALLVYAGVLWARAAEPSVIAVLSNTETEVGMKIELTITVIGLTETSAPPGDVAVDGLDIRYLGQRTIFKIVNNRPLLGHVYDYAIVPLKAGRFTIPATAILARGELLKTERLTLTSTATTPQMATSLRSKPTPDTTLPASTASVRDEFGKMGLALFDARVHGGLSREQMLQRIRLIEDPDLRRCSGGLMIMMYDAVWAGGPAGNNSPGVALIVAANGDALISPIGAVGGVDHDSAYKLMEECCQDFRVGFKIQ